MSAAKLTLLGGGSTVTTADETITQRVDRRRIDVAVLSACHIVPISPKIVSTYSHTDKTKGVESVMKTNCIDVRILSYHRCVQPVLDQANELNTDRKLKADTKGRGQLTYIFQSTSTGTASAIVGQSEGYVQSRINAVL